MRELCFDLQTHEYCIINEDLLLNSLISFAVSNNVSIGGNLNTGFCLCSEETNIPATIRKNLLDFICEKYKNEFKAIIFKKYDNDLDDFVLEEETLI